MARSSPQSFEKRQRERRKQMKRAEKFERRLIRNEEKRIAKAEGRPPGTSGQYYEDYRHFSDDEVEGESEEPQEG